MANIFIKGVLSKFQSVREAKAFLAEQAAKATPKTSAKSTPKPKADE